MKEAIDNINVGRRSYAQLSLANFIETYLMGSLFEDKPSKHMLEVLGVMENSLKESIPI